MAGAKRPFAEVAEPIPLALGLVGGSGLVVVLPQYGEARLDTICRRYYATQGRGIREILYGQLSISKQVTMLTIAAPTPFRPRRGGGTEKTKRKVLRIEIGSSMESCHPCSRTEPMKRTK